MSAAQARPRIGFIGVGIMGKPMARNLLRAGYPLAVYNRTAARCADLVADGASAPGSPAAVARESDVLITIVPGWRELDEVLHGPHGAARALRAGTTHVSMETIAPERARAIATELRESGVHALDAPVSGGETGAAEGTLSIMAGGSPDVFASMRPVLSAMGRNVVLIGDHGAGQIAKACNQLIVAVTIEAVAEALALARAFGVDQAKVRDALMGGFATSRILELHGQRMIERNFAPGGALRGHLKDRAIIAEASAGAGLTLPAATLVFDRIQAMVDAGSGGLDHSALYTLLEGGSGVA